jgi:hypothetical protein
VVKRPPPDQPYDPDAADFPAPASLFFNHWAGLDFLGQVADDQPLTPRCYAGDRAAGVVVMEDLGQGQGIDDLLLGDDPRAAAAALIELATMLGRMHALTMGKESLYNRIREGLGPHPQNTEYYSYQWLATTFHTTVATLKITPPPGAEEELAALINALGSPGLFSAYTHGDPCPDNALRTATGMKLIDFDIGGFRHALTEGVYGRIHFPTCWCVNRIPEHIVLNMEAVYRSELAQGCAEAAEDDHFYPAVVMACAYWLLAMTSFRPLSVWLESDLTWGIATVRQRYLARADILAHTAEEFGYLPAMGATFKAIAAELRLRWPEADTLPYYPAFRQPS